MEPISQRIYDYFFKHKGYKNDTVIAKELGYSHPEKISRLFREGKAAKPSVDILEDLTNTFGKELNIEWVITGIGDMIKVKRNYYTFSGEDEPPYKKSGPAEAPDNLLLVLHEEMNTMRLSLERLSKAAEAVQGSGTLKVAAPEPMDLNLDKKAGPQKSGRQKDIAHGKNR